MAKLIKDEGRWRKLTVKRRQFVSAMAGSLAALRERAQVLLSCDARPHQMVREQLPLDLDTSGRMRASLPYTEMLDVIRDTGFNGYRFTGWPGIIDRIGMDIVRNWRRSFQSAISRSPPLSDSADPADDPAKQPAMEKSARDAFQFLKRFGPPRW